VEETVRSALAQTHGVWELILIADASTNSSVLEAIDGVRRGDDRVRILHHDGDTVAGALNAGITVANHDYVVFLDPGGRLDPVALEWLGTCAPLADLAYTDEDVVDARGSHIHAAFKPAWSPRLLLGRDYVGHLTCVSIGLLRDLGGFDPDARGAEMHDLLLRISEMDVTVAHVPFVAYHGLPASRDPEGVTPGLEAVRRSIDRRTWAAAAVVADPSEPTYRVVFDHTADHVAVKVVVPTRDRVDLLRSVVDGVLHRTLGVDLHLVIVDNGSTDPETLEFLDRLADRREDVTVVRIEGAFNFSGLCNAGATAGPAMPYLLFLNNDVEILDGDWLSQLVGWTESDPHVVAVGPKLLFADHTIQHAGVVLGFRGVAGHYALGEADEPRSGSLHDCAREVSGLTAACLLVRTSSFEALGGFDESLDVDFQDVDLCLRLRLRLGGTLMYDPTFPLIHHQSATRGSAHEPSAIAAERMQARWGPQLECDPYYSPHLSLTLHDASLRPLPDDDPSLRARAAARVVRPTATTAGESG
jgi:GT2 family glycosyltransferase